MKTCSKCQVELHLEQFSKDKRAKDGLQAKCKKCEKKYKQEHKQKIIEQMKKYYEEHKEEICEQAKKYREEHKEEIREQKKKYREENKEKISEQNKKYYEEHKEEICEQAKKYYEEHKEEIIEQKNKYLRNRRKTDEGFRILGRLRARLHSALKGANKSASTMELVGAPSVEFLRDYLEGTKVEGKDYSDAHVDHIRPCASFDMTDPEQQRECFHYTNLQWLPSKENISKGAKLVF